MRVRVDRAVDREPGRQARRLTRNSSRLSRKRRSRSPAALAFVFAAAPCRGPSPYHWPWCAFDDGGG